tara:strand:+ start:206 stop:850 length:645 start_codon:yes stop_codon:yes gene_type:complete
MLKMRPLVNESKVEENFRKLTMEEKQVVNNTIAKFNKFNEHVYRPKSVKEVIGAIKELCELAGKVALSETDDWFDSVTVKKDVKEINANLSKFEKAANEVNTMQQRMEALYEDIGQKLGRYYQIGENDNRIPLAPSKKVNEVRGPIKDVETRIKKGSRFDMDELMDDYGFEENVDGVPVEKLFRNGRALRDMSIIYDQRGDMYLMDTKDIPKYH